VTVMLLVELADKLPLSAVYRFLCFKLLLNFELLSVIRRHIECQILLL